MNDSKILSEPTIGESIRRMRKEQNMTQKELGEKLGGISQQQIGQWENGIKNPKKETLQKIADALGISPYSLYSFDMATEEIAKELPIFNSKCNEAERRLPPGYTIGGDDEGFLCLFYPDGGNVPCDIDEILEIIDKAADYCAYELEKFRKNSPDTPK